MPTKWRVVVSVLATLALAAADVRADPGGEPEFCTVTVKEVARHLVLETDQFEAVFDNVPCKKRYRKSFRVQVAGEPYYPRGVPKNRVSKGWVKIPRVLLPVVKRRGQQAPVEFKYEDETLVKIPAGGTSVVIGKQSFDITGKKRTLFVDSAGRVRESDLALRARTFLEEAHVGRVKLAAMALHSGPYRMNSEGMKKLLRSHSAADLRLLSQYFQQGSVVKKGLQEAIQQKEPTQQTNVGDPELHAIWLGWRGMTVIRKEGAAEASDGTLSAQEDQHDEDYPSTSSGLRVVNWDAVTCRGKLAMDFRETAPPDRQRIITANQFLDFETGRGVTIVFEGYPWSTDEVGVNWPGIQVFGDPAPLVSPRRSDNTRDIQYSYAKQASGSFPKHTATIQVEGGPFAYWIMRITEGGKKLQVGESIVDLTGPKKHILFKYDGSIEVGDEPILPEKRSDK